MVLTVIVQEKREFGLNAKKNSRIKLILVLIALIQTGCGVEMSGLFQGTAVPDPTSTPIPLPTLQPLVNQFENTEPDGPIYSIAWSPDGTEIAVGSGKYDEPHDNGTLVIWEIPNSGD